MSVDEWIGSFGVAVLLVAFVLNLSGTLARSSRSYQALNGFGAAVACYASWRIGFIPFVVLEAVWAAASLAALVVGVRPR